MILSLIFQYGMKTQRDPDKRIDDLVRFGFIQLPALFLLFQEDYTDLKVLKLL